jgi:hypothetical protein
VGSVVIQLALGHRGIQTTQRYVGSELDLNTYAISVALQASALRQASARRACRPGRSGSVVRGSSCQIHQSYGGVWG